MFEAHFPKINGSSIQFLRLYAGLAECDRISGENRHMRNLIEQGPVHRFVVPHEQRVDFTGRENVLGEICATFEKDMNGVKRVALTGLGGIG